MNHHRFITKIIQASLCVALTACAGRATVKHDDVPASLRAPESQRMFMKVHATGVQIYVCQALRDDPARFAWFFKAPEAQLFGRGGRNVGKHYAGPSWESKDGSKVVGSVVAKETPNPQAIPWLLLSVQSTTGRGVFTDVRSIQRLHTVGGMAPPGPCGQNQMNQELHASYSADYVFYR